MNKPKTFIAILSVFAVGAGVLLMKNAPYVKTSVPEAISIEDLATKQKLEQTTTKPATEKNVEPKIDIPAPTITKKAPPAVAASAEPATTTPDPAPTAIAAATIPKELNLAMKFYTQAPFGDWGQPWQDACEEASALLIANEYYHHNWTRTEFRDQISVLVDWENKTFGYYKDTTTQEMVQFLQDFLNLKSVTHSNPTFADVQAILNQGHFIIIPLAGKEIGNPFYTNGGPDYHVMVIKGYKESEKVIAEDVGTQHGENYVYSWKTLMNANHDFTTPIDNGAKIIIEVLPPS